MRCDCIHYYPLTLLSPLTQPPLPPYYIYHETWLRVKKHLNFGIILIHIINIFNFIYNFCFLYNYTLSILTSLLPCLYTWYT